MIIIIAIIVVSIIIINIIINIIKITSLQIRWKNKALEKVMKRV